MPGLLLHFVDEFAHVPREHVHLGLLVVDHILDRLPLHLDDVFVLELLPVELRKVSVHHVAIRFQLGKRGEKSWRRILLGGEVGEGAIIMFEV